ncbi:MAG: phosphoenolpyruvate mutase [Alphaproteobacteria bacterium]|nr:phosphoenolpyruvate mutase [Alphaproteobacteria bacterium]
MSENVLAFPKGSASEVRKTTRFREMLTSPETSFIMEAHNGLSAKIVEETGFEGVWASGLSMSAALGVRDSNEASWTQVLEVLEFMADATSIPILVDADTGYGNFNNFRRLVNKLIQRDIAAVCIEDKLFPKTNSFLGQNQPLADVDEFCGKIRAGKDAQADDSFSVVARVEALIAGWGLKEALRRAEAYHEAGADAILIHSKESVADEILAFTKEWANRSPVVIVPTKYYGTPTQHFRDAGVNLIIWANHNMRAAISAMRETSQQIFENQNLVWAEENVARLGDVFVIAGNEELSEAEDRYLAKRAETKAVILAATRGSKLEDLTMDRPKCMVDVRGKPLLHRLVGSFNDAGVRELTVVTGYKADTVNFPGINTAENTDFETTGEVASLACSMDALKGECVVSYGDIMFRSHVLNQLLDCEADIAVVVDANWKQERAETTKRTVDLAACSHAYTGDYFDDEVSELTRLDSAMNEADANGEWIGLAKFSANGSELLRAELDNMKSDGSLAKASMNDLFNRLIDSGAKPQVVYITGNWLDVNDAFDLARARNF